MSFLGNLIRTVSPTWGMVSDVATWENYAYAADVIPPARERGTGRISDRDAATIPAVYRALQLLSTGLSQLPITVERGGRRIDRLPDVIRRPSMDLPSRRAFVSEAVMSLAVDGNLFLLPERDDKNVVIHVEVLDPHRVRVFRDIRTNAIRYGYGDKEYTTADVVHTWFLKLPGQLRGMGPIQAAQHTMRGTLGMRDYMAEWFDGSGQPAGILTSEQGLTRDELLAARNSWNGLDADGNPLEQTKNPSGIKVMGKGMHYEPILLKPADAMWLDAQSFNVLDVARLFGVPPTLLAAAVEGSSDTYANVEQEWIGYARWTLAGYTNAIEDALTLVTPNGQTVRFNFEGLLRSDTKTRYEAHQIAIKSGFLSVQEVRDIENLGPAPADLTPPKTQETPA